MGKIPAFTVAGSKDLMEDPWDFLEGSCGMDGNGDRDPEKKSSQRIP